MCRNFGLAQHNPDRVDLLEPACRAWSCPDCGPVRKRVFEALVYAGEPTKFLTLTIKRTEDGHPVAACDLLLNGWNILLKRLKRLHGKNNVHFVWVVEGTKKGWPHLHIALRMPFTAQRWLSAAWHEITGSSIVDIRRPDTAQQMAQYLSKYLAKAPVRFGTHKRYHYSRHWAPGFKQVKEIKPRVFGEARWERVRGFREYLHRLVQQAHLVEQTTERTWIAWRLGYYPERSMAIPWVARRCGLPEPPQRASNTHEALQPARRAA